MKRLGLMGAACVAGTLQAADDSFLWLEQVTAAPALKWVEANNAVTLDELTQRPGYQPLYDKLLAIFNSNARIPYVQKVGGHFYNLWRDAAHPRGIWRRASLDEYRRPEPAWEIVLDLDALARAEQENWVWHGVKCLPPTGERCLIALSRGGADAQVTREFDTVAKAFVEGGFYLPEAKGEANWIDRDHVFVATDFGPGSLTRSGYPRSVRLWPRGATLDEAKPVYDGQPDDMAVQAAKDFTPGFEREFVIRAMTFYSDESYLRDAKGQLRKIDKPDDAKVYAVRDQILLELRSDWTVGAKTYPQGALIAMDFGRYLQGERDFELLYTPGPRKSLDGFAVTRSHVLINELDNVRNRVYELTREDGRWRRRVVDLPAFGAIGISAVDPVESDDYFVTLTDFTTPTSLYLGHAGRDERELLKQLPPFFDATAIKVEQHEATSRDGTRVLYFVVMHRDTRLDGRNPTLLYGYGGFEISMQPAYSGAIGNGWLAQGGVYVLANIRGGGEFGPAWHQAALKATRQRAFDDFIAVGEDLIARKLTSPAHLGIMGGSNGGLLVGAVMVQRPELFRAVVCQVPLLDMQRYHKLLAGASWMGEYGDPDKPEEWAFLSAYSPYHNVKPGVKYPRTLFVTSTRDDRVHPGHARKMVARMQEQGHDVLYFENTEGGHAGAANNEQQAKMSALTYTFLLNELR